MSRLARITLAQAPAFISRGPSNAIALLCAHLRNAGFAPVVHDASLGARRRLSPCASRGRPDHFDYPEEFLAALKASPERFRRIIDAEARAILAGEPDIVGFSVIVATEECSLALARRVKELSPRTLVLLGGPQCLRETMAFDLIREDSVDAVALGEADRSIVEVARRFAPGSPILPRIAGLLVKESGDIIDCGDPEEVEDMDSLPFMDFSGFDLEGYSSECLHLNGSRGCVRKCSFCTHILQQKVYRRMSAPRIVAEINHHLRRQPGKYFVEFGDSLVNGDVRRLAELSRMLMPLRLERAAARRASDFGWGGMAIIHPTMTSSLLRLMRQGGCQTLAYGLESASQRVVDLMRKRFRVADAERIIRDTRAAGISVKLFLLVGFPGETDADFRLTMEFLRRHEGVVDGVSISYCEIQKGSHLDARLEEHGVEIPVVDRIRWRTCDGSNTWETRRQRYHALRELASALGMIADRKPRARVLESGVHAR